MLLLFVIWRDWFINIFGRGFFPRDLTPVTSTRRHVQNKWCKPNDRTKWSDCRLSEEVKGILLYLKHQFSDWEFCHRRTFLQSSFELSTLTLINFVESLSILGNDGSINQTWKACSVTLLMTPVNLISSSKWHGMKFEGPWNFFGSWNSMMSWEFLSSSRIAPSSLNL